MIRPFYDLPSRLDLLDAGDELAAFGFRLTPLIEWNSKLVPPGKGWATTATCDPLDFERRLAGCSFPSGLGFPADDDFIVVDLDRGHSHGRDGVETFTAIVRANGTLPLGPRVLTPRGGLQLWFGKPCDFPIRVGPIRDKYGAPTGIDIIGNGQLIIAPPSRRRGIAYVWRVSLAQEPIPDAPDWLLRLLHRAPPPPPVRTVPRFASGEDRYAEAALNNILADLAARGRGARNHALFRAGARLFGFVAAGRLSDRVVEDGLRAACLANGLIHDDGEYAFASTLRSARACGFAQPCL